MKITLLATSLVLMGAFNALASQEVETESLKKTNQDLKLENQILQAENNLLRKLIQNYILKLKLHDLETNMKQVETMLKFYAENTSGLYPSQAEFLYQQATHATSPYFKPLVNPFTGAKWDRENPAGKGVIELYSPEKKEPGLMLYEPEIHDQRKEVISYHLWGCDQRGEIIHYYVTSSHQDMIHPRSSIVFTQ